MKTEYKIRDAFAKSEGGLSSVIGRVSFVIEVSDDQTTLSSFFPVDLDDPSPDSFIEYENLTREQVMQWVLNKVDPEHVKALEHGLISRLTEQTETQKTSLVRVSLLDN
jgi:hypothetical protein